MAESLSSDKRCRLLDLPAELRTSIWELVVISEEPLVIRNSVEDDQSPPGQYVSQPGLLSTCHMVRQETLSMFYSANTFLMHVEVHLSSEISKNASWLLTIRPQNAKHLRNIQLHSNIQCGGLVADEFVPWIMLFSTAIQTIPPARTIQFKFTNPDWGSKKSKFPEVADECEKLGRQLRSQGFVDLDREYILRAMWKHLELLAIEERPGLIEEWPGLVEDLRDWIAWFDRGETSDGDVESSDVESES